MNNEIKYIEVEKLHPHPDNPRKDLGDLSELIESIKKNGVLQNLTVVPATGFYHGDYTVIIGHRRLAAATEAGLTTLPCVVLELTKTEQVSMMIVENMQRSDLTLYEQAQGMQMMLDLGETVESISEKTGLSETTVRRRVRLTTLNDDLFRDVTKNRQIDICDYDRIFELENPKDRDKALEAIGTNNFNFALDRLKSEEKRKRNHDAICAALDRFATKVDKKPDGAVLDECFYTTNDAEEVEAREGEYYYFDGGYTIDLYRMPADDENDDDEDEDVYSEERELKRELEEINKTMYGLRKNFVRELLRKKVKDDKDRDTIDALAAIEISESGYYDAYDAAELLDDEVEGYGSAGMCELLERHSAYAALIAELYVKMDSEHLCCNMYGSRKYYDNDKMKRLYDFLVDMGYEMSDEETAIVQGTHRLYKEENEDKPI